MGCASSAESADEERPRVSYEVASRGAVHDGSIDGDGAGLSSEPRLMRSFRHGSPTSSAGGSPTAASLASLSPKSSLARRRLSDFSQRASSHAFGEEAVSAESSVKSTSLVVQGGGPGPCACRTSSPALSTQSGSWLPGHDGGSSGSFSVQTSSNRHHQQQHHRTSVVSAHRMAPPLSQGAVCAACGGALPRASNLGSSSSFARHGSMTHSQHPSHSCFMPSATSPAAAAAAAKKKKPFAPPSPATLRPATFPAKGDDGDDTSSGTDGDDAADDGGFLIADVALAESHSQLHLSTSAASLTEPPGELLSTQSWSPKHYRVPPIADGPLPSPPPPRRAATQTSLKKQQQQPQQKHGSSYHKLHHHHH